MARKIMLVTGASSGIGAATARMAAARGFDVGINYRSNRSGAEAVAQAAAAAGARTCLIQADVADPDAVADLFDAVDTDLGRINVLVNNAGIVAPAARLDEMSPERMMAVINTNLLGSLLCAQAAIRRMSTRHGGAGGVIVNLSSVAAKLGSPAVYVDYAASKGGIDTFTRGLAREVATEGIRVNGVRPGIIDTPIHDTAGTTLVEDSTSNAALVPMLRPGTAAEVAEAILWLASDAAGYVTGETIGVTGGR